MKVQRRLDEDGVSLNAQCFDGWFDGDFMNLFVVWRRSICKGSSIGTLWSFGKFFGSYRACHFG